MNTPCENIQKNNNQNNFQHNQNSNQRSDNGTFEYNLEDLIIRIKNQFDVNDIEDYKDIIFIIYNSLFLNEDKIDTREKLRIFSLIEMAVNQISNNSSNNICRDRNNNSSRDDRRNRNNNPCNMDMLSYDDLYNIIVPYHMQKSMSLMYRGFIKNKNDVPNIPPFLQ